MNLNLIRFTDKYFGGSLRLALYYYQRFRDLFPQRYSSEPFHRILIVKFWGIGNIVRASPVFKAVRERFPQAQITFITLSQNRGVYEGSDLFDEVIYLNLKSVPAFLWDMLKKFFLLRRKKFELVLNLEPWANFPEIISFYISAGARVGFTAPVRRSLFNIKVPFREDEHISRSFFRILYPFGVRMPSDLLPVPIPLTEDERAKAKAILHQAGITDDDTVVAINVNASEVAEERRWPREKFALLADMVSEKLNAKTAFIGSPRERERVQEVINLTHHQGANLAGKTTLREAIAILKRADIFVTNDSGPMHLAMAMRTPTVALFGPESPKRYGPLSNQHIAIFKDYDCSPCIFFVQAKKIKCTQRAKCMTEITVEKVFQAVETIY